VEPGQARATASNSDYSLWELPGGDAEYMLYYAGRWPTDGYLHAATSYLHIHTQHEISYLIEAEPSELGLGAPPLVLADVCTPLSTDSLNSSLTGGSNAALRARLQRTCPSCFMPSPLVCTASSSMTDCVDGRAFTRSTAFTVVAFYKANAAVNGDLPTVHHNTWFLRYHSADGQYHFTRQIYNQQSDGVGLVGTKADFHTSQVQTNGSSSFPQPRSEATLF
jgi:hypothetical protein